MSLTYLKRIAKDQTILKEDTKNDQSVKTKVYIYVANFHSKSMKGST